MSAIACLRQLVVVLHSFSVHFVREAKRSNCAPGPAVPDGSGDRHCLCTAYERSRQHLACLRSSTFGAGNYFGAADRDQLLEHRVLNPPECCCVVFRRKMALRTPKNINRGSSHRRSMIVIATVRPADAGQAAPAETSQTPKHSA